MSPCAKGSRRVEPPSPLEARAAALLSAPATASAVVVPAVPAVAATPASAPVMVTDCCSSTKAGIQTLSSRTMASSGIFPCGAKSKERRASFSSGAAPHHLHREPGGGARGEPARELHQLGEVAGFPRARSGPGRFTAPAMVATSDWKGTRITSPSRT